VVHTPAHNHPHNTLLAVHTVLVAHIPSVVPARSILPAAARIAGIVPAVLGYMRRLAGGIDFVVRRRRARFGVGFLWIVDGCRLVEGREHRLWRRRNRRLVEGDRKEGRISLPL